jgi:2-polyprenyl-3-methyl-5-hydroxy-6-metoxy-1,4-benzoquinol methylase/spore coat polysaccharide biosynthesis predicted glycosyltransferase SpsG
VKEALLVVPAFGEGLGGGHLVRSAALVREFREAGREAFLYIPAGSRPALLGIIGTLDPSWLLGSEAEFRRRAFTWIILDRFKTGAQEFERWAALAPVIGIDEGGPARERFDFLIDLFPGLPGIHRPNLCAPYLLPMPKNRRKIPFSFQDLADFRAEDPGKGRTLNVLVSFGAEDPASLTVPSAFALLPPERERDRVKITVIFGSLNRELAPGKEPWEAARVSLENAGIRVLGSVPELREQLGEYDLVVTHFGITAFECLHAGVSVILLAPTRYHEQLALEAGFLSAGVGRNGVKRLRALIYEPEFTLSYRFFRDINIRCRELALNYFFTDTRPQSLGNLIAGFSPHIPSGCPVCGQNDRLADPVLARFSGRTYRRCRRCGLSYMLRLTPPPIEYEADYFFDFYKKQYGKTYLEDFPNIKRLSRGRLHRIRRLFRSSAKAGSAQGLKQPVPSAGSGGGRILDVGCAYGPFLDTAREEGFEPMGIDPSREAVEYVRSKLGIPAFEGFFPDISYKDLGGDRDFAAVTLWYVIEHLRDPRKAFMEIHRLLRPGGVLAFSTPSFSGISGRKSPLVFLEKSPEDHWTIWDPRRLSQILDRFGFEVKKIVITGHHPERFPIIGKHLRHNWSLLYRPSYGVSRILGWGDTFEVYVVKRTGL